LLASVLAVALAGVAITRLSVTIDEWRYIHDGVKWWFGGDAVWLVDAGVLPLTFWIQNAPGSLYLWLEHGGLPGGTAIDFGKSLPLGDQIALLRLARSTNLCLAGLGTIWTAWLMANRWFGARAAGIAALFCAVEPNLLAGYALGTADAFIVPFALCSMLAYSSCLGRPGWMRVLATGVCMGLGLALKISLLPLGMLLIAAVFLVHLAGHVGTRSASSRPLVLSALASLRFLALEIPLIAGIALAIAWCANGFLTGWLLDPSTPNEFPRKVAAALGQEGAEAAKYVSRLQAVRVPAPLAVLRSQAGHSRWGHAMTFLGRSGLHGPWYYYPYVFLMKTHLLLLAAAGVGILVPSARRSPVAWGALLLVLLSCTMGIKGGPRYFLVLYALLAVLGGVGVAAISGRLKRTGALLATSALGFTALSMTCGSLPDLLTHTNPPWGGDEGGYRYADANYDWGQGLDLAAASARGLGLRPVVYLHTGDPYFGVPDGQEVLDCRDPGLALERMRGRIAAVSVYRLFHSGAESSPLTPLTRSLVALGADGRLCRTFFYFDLRNPSRFAQLARLLEHETLGSRGRIGDAGQPGGARR
jgi:hypothetical protein